MKNLIGILCLILVVFTGFAQPENATVETINGKKYYVHIVEQGNTLYGIHKLYNTPVEKILSANEGLSDNLTIGQKVLIPIETSNDVHYGTHIVSSGETLYGISKKYNCSVDDLKNINPGIESGIQPGQQIKVPMSETIGGTEVIQTDPVDQHQNSYNISLNDSIVMHTVLAHETMYSISKRYMVSMDTIRAVNGMKSNKVKEGDVLKIPVKKVSYEIIEKDLTNLVTKDSLPESNNVFRKKETYHIALMLPFMLAKNDHEMTKSLMIDQVRELYPTTKIAFQFYQGFIMAADSLAKAGLKVKIYVYDTNRDTATVAKLFKKPEFSDMDLVVGPLYGKVIDVAVRECFQRKIRIVLPFKSDARYLVGNPYVFKAVASNMTLMDGAVDYLIQKHSHHKIFIFKPSLAGDLALYERVRDRYNNGVNPNAYTTKLIEVTLGSKSGRELAAMVNTDTTNIFIVPSENVKFVSDALLRLNAVLNIHHRAKNMKIIAFGLEDWNQFDDLDMTHQVALNQHYASYRYVDYNQGEGLEFVRAFRAKNDTDPTVYSSQGFDVGMYFLGALHLYGADFDQFLTNYKVDLVQNDFQFKSVASGAGYENQRVCIVRYNQFRLEQLQ